MVGWCCRKFKISTWKSGDHNLLQIGLASKPKVRILFETKGLWELIRTLSILFPLRSSRVTFGNFGNMFIQRVSNRVLSMAQLRTAQNCRLSLNLQWLLTRASTLRKVFIIESISHC